MTDAEIVAALAEALHERLCGPLIGGSGCLSCCDDAAALLPVVRRVAEQRAAEAVQPVLDLADELEADAQLQVDDSDSLPLVVGRSWVNAARQFRAAALTATPNHGTDTTT